MSIQKMVTEFHTAMGQDVGHPVLKKFQNNDGDYARSLSDKQQIDTMKLLKLRLDLIEEESKEFLEAGMPVDALKEAADLVYVLFGWAVTFGLDLEEAIRRVHASNMSKLVDGKPLLREDGKVLKGPNYEPAVLGDLLLA